MKTILLTAYFAVSFYVLGGLMIENDVNYPTWYYLDAASFSAYHRALANQLPLYLFVPMGIHLLLNGLLIWQTPTYPPRWALLVTFGLSAYVIAESLLVQVPIHNALAVRYSTELVDKLITYHRLFRLPVELLIGGINGWLLLGCLRTGAQTPATPGRQSLA